MLDRRVVGAGVVLGDDHHQRGEHQAHHAGAPELQHRHARVGRDHVLHHPVGDEIERDEREDSRDREAAIQRVHDLAALRRLHEEAADDGGDDGHGAEHQRVGDGVADDSRAGQQQRRQHHGRDDGDRVGLEQVRRHAGAAPTLSPTLSAITAGLRGSSSGMPASTLPTRSAPTSAPW